MTNSYFSPQAQPRDTYVTPSTTAPFAKPQRKDPPPKPSTTNEWTGLVNALAIVNPAIQKYLGYKQLEWEKKEEGLGIQQAIEDSADGFKDVVTTVKQEDGIEKARQVIGGSMFRQGAYERTKATILGNTIESKLESNYSSAVINSKPIVSYKADSPEFQDWLSTQTQGAISQLGDINPIHVNNKFSGKLTNATSKIVETQIKKHNEWKLEHFKGLSAPIVRNIIANKDNPERVEEIIGVYEKSIIDLGITGKDRTDINEAIIEVLKNEALAVGMTDDPDDGDFENAMEILDLAAKFPWGPGGQLTLDQNADFLEAKNEIRDKLEDYRESMAVRKEKEAKRLKQETIHNGLKDFSKAIQAGDTNKANEIMSNLSSQYPEEASKLNVDRTALDGTSIEKWTQLRSRIVLGGFESKADASIAALQWFNEAGYTPQNAKQLDILMRNIDNLEQGNFSFMNKSLGELQGQINNEFRRDSSWFIADTGLLKGAASSKSTKVYNAARDKFYDWFEEYQNKNNKTPSQFEQEKQFRIIRDEALKEAQKEAGTSVIESGVGSGDNNDLQGAADTNQKQSSDQAQPGDWYKDKTGQIYIMQDFGKFTPSRRLGTGKEVQAPSTENNNQNDSLQGAMSSNPLTEGINNVVNSLFTPPAAAGTLDEQDRYEGSDQLPTMEEAIQNLPPVPVSKQQALIDGAAELGVKPEDLAAIISYETIGTFDPQIVGTDKDTGDTYQGLIQFGPWEREHYNITTDMSFQEQVKAAVQFMKDRGVKPGHGPKEMYAAVLTGHVSNIKKGGLDWVDANGTTVNKALKDLLPGGGHYEKGVQFLKQQS